MCFFLGLLCVVVTLGSVTSSPPCIQVTHSECGDDDGHLFDELTVPDKASCQTICSAIGPKCKFSLYDNEPFSRGNCRVYDESLRRFIIHCNEISGPKVSPNGCNVEFPPDDNCQIYRHGKCDYEEAQENENMQSWESCGALCQSNGLCKAWQFYKEEKLCKILYSEERKCTWEFSPRIPEEEKCDVPPPTTAGPPTTSTTTTTTTTEKQGICKQEGRNPIPGVDCSHDFYCCDEVGDSRPTLCTCNNGLWYNQDPDTSPCTWGDMLEPECYDKTLGHTIDEFTRADHSCSDGTICD